MSPDNTSKLLQVVQSEIMICFLSIYTSYLTNPSKTVSCTDYNLGGEGVPVLEPFFSTYSFGNLGRVIMEESFKKGYY